MERDTKSLSFLAYLFGGMSVMLLFGLVWVGIQLQQAEELNKVQAEQIKTIRQSRDNAESDQAHLIDQHWHDANRRAK